jgi:hypothetical protein
MTRKLRLFGRGWADRRVRFGTPGDEQSRASGRPNPVGRNGGEKIDVPQQERRRTVTRLLIRVALLFGAFAAITPAQAGTVGNVPTTNGLPVIALASNAVAVSGATLEDAVATVIDVRVPR